MRENKLLRLLKEGRPAIGVLTPFRDPEAVEFRTNPSLGLPVISCSRYSWRYDTRR